jgi:L-aspartate oxidase
MKNSEQNQSDFLVIGSGVAGLVFALSVAERGTVTVITKSDPTEGSTKYAQGGIASVTDPLDSFESHIADTLDAGAGLCDEAIVSMVVSEGPAGIKDLIAYGANFDMNSQATDYELAQEGGHSARRILHAADATGAEIQRAILDAAQQHKNITIKPYHIAIDLIKQSKLGNTEVLGVYAMCQKTGEISSFSARMTMIATGGVGKVYLYTSNPDIATGDGIAMAYRAGCKIANMEFIQFHPTCLYHPLAKSFLITEAMRGEGARLLDIRGNEFMTRFDKRKELSPRDIVARAIDQVMKESGDDFVYLDISHRDADFLKKRFPTIYETVLGFGYDITKQAIPVVPAAHYCCGGIVTDSLGRSSLQRLYAAGEAAYSGLHGANRLASNSLLEALVFAKRAAKDALERFDQLPRPVSVPLWDFVDSVKSNEEIMVSHSWDEVRRVMWNLVGIVRSNQRLDLAQRKIAQIKQDIRSYYWSYRVTSDLIEVRNIIDTAEIIIECAQSRHESRGLHYNIDYPKLGGKDWIRPTVITISA